MPGDCVEIKTECADRLARVEAHLEHLIDNDLKHIATDINEIKGALLKVVIALLTVAASTIIGFAFSIIMGHIR